MRIIIVIMTSLLIHVHAISKAQQVTIKSERITLKQAFNEVRKQTGFYVLYRADQVRNLKPVRLNVNNVPLEEAMKAILLGSDLEFTIKNKAVILSEKEKPSFLDKVVDALAPPIDVSGVVLDEKGAPLVGATVRVKGVNQSTTTDAQGKFSLQGVDDKAVLVITFIGYTPKEVTVKAILSVSLEVQPSELQEVVVAYGKTTQQALTGSVTVIKGDQIQNLPNRSFDKSLQGLVPGLQVTNGTGQPGGGVSNFVLRGVATATESFGSGMPERNPLIVIDGIPVNQEPFQPLTGNSSTPYTNPLAQLNPSDIESISVLKDAAAIALYGAKASNGVILVVTKKGRIGKTQFNFRSQTDLSHKTEGKLKVLNQAEYLRLLFDTYKSSDASWTDETILKDLKLKFPVRSDGSFYPAGDWDGEIFNSNALTTTNEFSISGGNEKNTFYLNIENLNQSGVVKKTGYDRNSFRINFENRPTTNVKLGTNSTMSYTRQLFANGLANPDGFSLGKIISPLNPVRNDNGQYIYMYDYGIGGGALQNPVAQSEYDINRNSAYRVLSNIYGEINFLNDFTFRSNLGVDFMLAETKLKVSPIFLANSPSGPSPFITERDSRRMSLINSNILTYNKLISSIHSVNLLIGQESQIMDSKDVGATAVGTAKTSPYYEQLRSPGYTMSDIQGFGSKQRQLSWFGQGTYSYAKKYNLTTSIRADGSSRFGDQQRWGSFWSAGIGWVISNESFLQSHFKWLDFLKVRGSIGAAGNSPAAAMDGQFDYISPIDYDGKQGVMASGTPGNPDIRWEETSTWDLGLESRLFGNRISFQADFYTRNTKDLIYNTNLPSFAGSPSYIANIGDMKNVGVELALNLTIIKTSLFSWNLNTNWSSNSNKLVKANVPLSQTNAFTIANEEGRNFNSYYVPVWAGVNVEDGRPQWIKTGGGVTNNYSEAEKQFVGKPQPDGFGTIQSSVTFKNFSLSASLYYQYGFQLFDETASFTFQSDGLNPYINQSSKAVDFWKKKGDISTNPRRILNNTDAGYLPSTRYLFDGDYLRLQNVILSYQFPSDLIKRLKINNLRVWMQGNNLALFTKYGGLDPDNANIAGSTGHVYPNSKTISFGLNIGF